MCWDLHFRMIVILYGEGLRQAGWRPWPKVIRVEISEANGREMYFTRRGHMFIGRLEVEKR